ncbi:MAG: flagellar export chaperone FliS [Burkholderiaceae bacterium]
MLGRPKDPGAGVDICCTSHFPETSEIMFGSTFSPSQAYSRISVDTSVIGADPHKLIELLYQGADDLLIAVDTALRNNDIATKGESITRVIRIVDEGLKAALNPQGGEISANLEQLYDYILRRLLEANRTNDRVIVAEVRSLLQELHSAWKAIGPAARKADGYRS